MASTRAPSITTAVKSEEQWNTSLRALRNCFLSAIPELINSEEVNSEEESSFRRGKLLGAVLSVVALRVLEANKTISSSHFDIPDAELLAKAKLLFERLSHFLKGALAQELLPVNGQYLSKVSQLLHNRKFDVLWHDAASIGFAYQAFGMAFRQKALTILQSANKEHSSNLLISFTQLYTPGWVVDFLLANTLLPTLGINASKFDYWLLKNDGSKETTKYKKISPEKIKVLDPACGAGNFLISAYELCRDAYIEAGASLPEAAANVLQNNLHGADIDPLAIQVCGLSLLVKGLIDDPNLGVQANNLLASQTTPDGTPLILGSLAPEWQNNKSILSKAYDVVITNPPYIGRRLMSRELKTSLRANFPDSRSDLCAAFLDKCIDWLAPTGQLGVITQVSMLSLPSYLQLRQKLSLQCDIQTTVATGSGVFPLLSGEKADSLLLIAKKVSQKEKAKQNGHESIGAIEPQFTMSNSKDKSVALKTALTAGNSNRCKSSSLSPFLKELTAHAVPLHTVADIRQGLATTNNDRFVKLYWDVDSSLLNKSWFPYLKGAGSEKWCSENNFLVNWSDNGREIKQAVVEAYPYLNGKYAWVVKNEQFYFKPGLCFSFVNKNCLAVRKMPAGCIFDVASSAIFTTGENEDFLLGYLNSTFASILATSINPTINFQVGDVKKLPLLKFDSQTKNKIANIAKKCQQLKARLLNGNEAITRTAPKSVYACVQDIKKAESHISSDLLQFTQLEISLDEVIMDHLKNLFSDRADTLSILEERMLNLSAAKIGIADRFFNSLYNNALNDLISTFMNRNGVESPCLVVHEKSNVFPNCNENSECFSYLEGKIRIKSSATRNGIVDFNRLFGQPSRYWGIRLPTCSALLILSSAAVRNFTENNSRILQYLDANENYSQAIQASHEAETFLVALKARTEFDKSASTKQLISACIKQL